MVLRPLITAALLGLALAASPAVRAQTAADSGWVPVFNGKDLPGDQFYVYQAGYVDVSRQTRFKVDSGMIHGVGAYSLLMTRKEYRYYRVRVEYRFGPGVGSNGNAGLMILMDNEAAKTDNARRPRSIEVNCRRDNDYPWTLWAGIDRGPYMTSTVKTGTNQYLSAEEGGKPFTVDITQENTRIIRSSYALSENPPGQWNKGEALVLGDKGEFWLNGKLRVKSWDWFMKKGDPATRVMTGGVGVQTEGFDIWYRKWEIMETDAQGNPLVSSSERFTVRPREARVALAFSEGIPARWGGESMDILGRTMEKAGAGLNARIRRPL